MRALDSTIVFAAFARPRDRGRSRAGTRRPARPRAPRRDRTASCRPCRRRPSRPVPTCPRWRGSSRHRERGVGAASTKSPVSWAARKSGSEPMRKPPIFLISSVRRSGSAVSPATGRTSRLTSNRSIRCIVSRTVLAASSNSPSPSSPAMEMPSWAQPRIPAAFDSFPIRSTAAALRDASGLASSRGWSSTSSSIGQRALSPASRRPSSVAEETPASMEDVIERPLTPSSPAPKLGRSTSPRGSSSASIRSRNGVTDAVTSNCNWAKTGLRGEGTSRSRDGLYGRRSPGRGPGASLDPTDRDFGHPTTCSSASRGGLQQFPTSRSPDPDGEIPDGEIWTAGKRMHHPERKVPRRGERSG